MRLVFLGTGDFAVPSLEALVAAGHEVAAVVTQPDREKGRGREIAPPPIKPVAARLGLTVFQPERIRAEEAVEPLRARAPEILVVVAYGQILPRRVLDLAPRGAVNVHGSLLPRWRGAAPIQWAIASGDPTTGVTTMLLDEGMDTGPTLLSRAIPIGPDDTAADLFPRLARMGADLLVATLAGLQDGSVQPRAQDPSLATHARMLEKEDGRIDWSAPAAALHCRLRGFLPWPGSFTAFDGRALKVLRARVEPNEPGPSGPGTVTRVDGDGFVVACGSDTRLRLVEVQPESRKPMAASAFALGARIGPGSRLG